VHGAFGETNDWRNKYRSFVSKYIDATTEIDSLVKRLCVYTDLSEEDKGTLVKRLKQDLLKQIDETVSNAAYRQTELSETLAVGGVLPLFGFPTRVRALYSECPAQRDDDDRLKVSDRSIEMAISSFSPGSEVIKDKQIHTCIGFAAWDYSGLRPLAKDPLGEVKTISRCQKCVSIETVSDGTEEMKCSICKQPTEIFKMYQPLGFRTDYRARDYDEQIERGPMLEPPLLAVRSNQSAWQPVGGANIVVLPGAEVYSINDNHHRMFEMYKMDDGSVLVPAESLYRVDKAPDQPDRAPDIIGAIGAVKTTDALLIRLDNIGLPGPDRTVETRREVLPAGLSALWSLGEAIRIAAGAELDVGPQEIKVGLRSASLGSSQTAEIFLCDSLDNGAGYCTHLASSGLLKKTFEKLLSDEFQGRWEKRGSKGHMDVCDSACPDCIRSYDNRQLHGFLDWRLAIDLAEAVIHGKPNWSRWLSESQNRATAFVKSWSNEDNPIIACQVEGLWALYASESLRAVLICHPLWRDKQESFTGSQNSGYATLQRLYRPAKIKCISVMEVSRKPQNTFSWLCAQES
jgi:DEAD/DEAH box helicase domain-containing protein